MYVAIGLVFIIAAYAIMFAYDEPCYDDHFWLRIINVTICVVVGSFLLYYGLSMHTADRAGQIAEQVNQTTQAEQSEQTEQGKEWMTIVQSSDGFTEFLDTQTGTHYIQFPSGEIIVKSDAE